MVTCICDQLGYCAGVLGDPLACGVCVVLPLEQPCPATNVWTFTEDALLPGEELGYGE